MTSLQRTYTQSTRTVYTDWVGVTLSALCAIHCMASPFLLFLIPNFGRIWSHPASHWGMALIVIPLACFSIKANFKHTGLRWVLWIGTTGIMCIIAGAIAPFFDPQSKLPVSSTQCAYGCCPSLITKTDGSPTLDIPLASILTLVGGLCLLATHSANLCCCFSSKTKKGVLPSK